MVTITLNKQTSLNTARNKHKKLVEHKKKRVKQ